MADEQSIVCSDTDSGPTGFEWPMISVDTDEGVLICQKMSQLTDIANAALALLKPPARRPTFADHNDSGVTAFAEETAAWENLRSSLATAGYSWEELP
jgi:hypothetical protein